MTQNANKDTRSIERRSKERVADDADWETKVLARVRGRLKQSNANAEQPSSGESNWEQDALTAIQGKLDRKQEK